MRSPYAPEIPSIVEAGYPGAVAVALTGFVAPRGTPVAIVTRLATEMNAILKLPDVIERWRSMSMAPTESSPEAFGKFIDSEIKRWTAVAKAANIKLK
jgi:tripartite-type tricarboxylate transporter receptor subunit TctC